MLTMLSILLVLIFFGLIAYVWITAVHKSIIALRNNVQNAWKNIDLMLQQRHDELPGLIETCKAYLKHESDILGRLTELHTNYSMTKEIDKKVKTENSLSELLGKLTMQCEQYLDLRASPEFIQIQARLSAVESKIADCSEAFNEAANIYNIQIDRIPDLIIARAMNCRRYSFLEISEEKSRIRR